MSHNSQPASGIQISSDGSRYVGGSLRKDGSVRKVIRVKEGFTPMEDVKRYIPPGRRSLRDGEGTIGRERVVRDKRNGEGETDEGNKVNKARLLGKSEELVGESRELVDESERLGSKSENLGDRPEDQLTDMLDNLQLKDEINKESKNDENLLKSDKQSNRTIETKNINQISNHQTIRSQPTSSSTSSSASSYLTDSSSAPPPPPPSSTQKYIPPSKRKPQKSN